MQHDQRAILDELNRTREVIHVAFAMASAAAAGDDPAPFHLAIESRPTYPVSWLADRLALSATEQRVLWVLIANELCPIARAKLRDINSEQLVDPALDTLRRVVYGTGPSLVAWRELGAEGRLRRLGLIERTDTGEVPEHRQTVKLARRVLALVHGDVGLDPSATFARFDDSAVELDELELDPVALHEVETAIAGDGLVIVRGGIGTGRRSLIASLVRASGRKLLVIDGHAIARDREGAARELRIAARECALFDAVPLVRHLDALAGAGEVADRLDLVDTELTSRACMSRVFEGSRTEATSKLNTLVCATTTRALSRRWGRAPRQIVVPALTGVQRARLWQRALPQASAGDADLLATIYPMAPALIRAAAAAAQRCADGTVEPHHIEAGIRSVLDDRLAGLATRITVTQTWDDLVLPDEQTSAVVELLARIRERRRVYEDWGFADKLGKGLGVSALFSGPPGTGKTMCAGLIARDLGTEIYQVDLSKLASKWIGETEKNLAALFDAAEAGHAILLFDEADAVFGKRTEVRTSNDRHANHETNYLLQRLETFAGICILTTNHESGIDEAFRRRLSVHVRFPMPEADERRRLWRALIPAAAPVGPELGLDQLGSTFVMSGGYIRNAVLRAAFLAADADTEISAAHLARAAQLEYEAMGKVIARN